MLWRRRPQPPAPRQVLESFALRILHQLQNRQAPWQRHYPSQCWIWPERFHSQQPYIGVHGLHLLSWAVPPGYSDPRWGTRAEIEAAGGQIPKDQTGVPGLPEPASDSQPSESPPADDRSEDRPPALFNVDQTEGLVLPQRRDREESSWKVYDRVERMLRASGVDCLHKSGNQACYRLKDDRVVVPPRSQFADSERYYQTVLHELGHATGHPDRRNRPVLRAARGDGPDSPDHAREELRAEIGALMTGARIGLGHRPRHGDVYLKSWIQILQSDPRELLRAASDAWQMSDHLVAGGREPKERASRPSSDRPRSLEAPRIRIRRVTPTLRSPQRPAPGSPRPGTDAEALQRFGWRGGEAEWIALVCRHSGWFTRAQFCAHFRCRRNRALRFVRRLVRRRHGVEEALDGLPTTTRPCRIAGKALYHALGLESVPHPRASSWVRIRRLLSLDYVLDHPHVAWRATEPEKIAALEAQGLSRRLFPCRHYAGHAQGRRRYFARHLPLALEPGRATFVYVDPGRDTDSELLSWGAEHAKLWAALRAQERPVHVVAVARDPDRQRRAQKVLRRWRRPGPEAEFGPLSPEEEQIIHRIEQAVHEGDAELLARHGGFMPALGYRQRLLKRPKVDPKIPKNRIRIDQGQTWLSPRIPAESEPGPWSA